MDVAAGTIVADRYAVEARAGAGGMGVVYRARDRATGATVALKLLRAQSEAPARRFAREAWLLSDLSHPGIVRYVDHGQTADGDLYLVMAWLDGVDLATRLARGALPLADALALGRRVADALAAAHEHGVVHRDLKPSNLFLVGGAAAAAVVLDFGLARLAAGMSTVTVQGTLMGTPGYMAPEQVRCEASVGPAADVFAFGCVLYECIAGRSPFAGERPWARLAKILFEEPPPLVAFCPAVPPGLDDLVHALLAKDPRERPADGRELRERLAAIATAPAPALPRATAITDDEVRLVSVVVASAPPATTAGDATETITGDAGARGASERGAHLHRLAADHGGRVEQLPQGLAIATLVGRGTATDAAVQAARCALAMRALLPDTRIVLTTGRAAYSGSWPIGTTIDRAADLLGDEAAAGAGVIVDPATAGLLDSRFDVVATPAGLVLGDERAVAGRTLLGRPSPFVGRDRELATLEALIAAALDEPVARAVVVTGDAGIGKSRLWQEVAPRLSDRWPSAELWIARGDPTSAGAPFALVAQAVRGAAGIRDGAPLAERQAAVQALVDRRVAVAERARVAAFLAELAGAPFADAGRDQLAAARQDPLRMGDQVRRAWEDLVAATVADHPLVIVVEDLHWGDLPSVTLLDAALRHAASRPLVVVGLARPDVHRTFPALWTDRRRDEVVLGALPRRGAAALVRATLGATTSEATVDGLVERAEGNAFFLEELIRASAEGRDDAPETVVAMVQARLDALEAPLRRALRAASIYGQTARPAGIAAALGVPASSRALAGWLAALRDKELLTEGRDGDACLYTFRHALVRDAVYASLTASDRALGHRLAATWLEAEGSGDALALADHLEKGGEPARAVAWLERAAHQALEGNDFAAALACVDRGIACGATGEALGGLLHVATQGYIWTGRLLEAATTSEQSLAHLGPGTARRYRALGRHVWLLAQRRDGAAVADAVAELHRPAASPEAEVARYIALCQAMNETMLAELVPVPPTLVEDVDGQFSADVPQSFTARPWRALLAAIHASLRNDRVAAHDWFVAAVAAFDAIGARRQACLNRGNAAFLCIQLGAFEAAEAILRESILTARASNLHSVVANHCHNLGLALMRMGRTGEARRVLEEAVRELSSQGYRSLEATARLYLGGVALEEGLPGEAHHHLDLADALLSSVPAQRPHLLALRARALMAEARHPEARLVIDEAIAAISTCGQLAEGAPLVWWTYVEALLLAHDIAGAREAARTARAVVYTAAAGLVGEQRCRFLQRIREHAAILALADDLLGPATTS
jgi:tetratricopeptide (TPR) repeat protein